ncbi:MAG: DUF2254 domain-containing protein [Chryseolinea sp.]
MSSGITVKRKGKINLGIWINESYHKVVNSIAFYPAIIAFLFLIFSVLSISFDFSDEGKQLKSQWQWLRLKDPSTARSIISSIAAGVISLTVFSFSMVMIVLNQTASQMSNRILDKLIGSRFQQIVLGIYVGTIVYALFLLSTIRDVDEGIHIPALSTYMLIAITICDIFLFIYFLHYITQSVKYDVIIRRIHQETKDALEGTCNLESVTQPCNTFTNGSIIRTERSGIFEGVSEPTLIGICDKIDSTVLILPTPGSFLLKGAKVGQSDKELTEEAVGQILSAIYIHEAESIEGNFFYGFRQLSEVAVKALSPGINDPGTAIQALRALFELLSYSVCHYHDNVIRNKEGKVRIIKADLTFEKIFTVTVMPVWDYGKNDRWVKSEMKNLLEQLQSITRHRSISNLLVEIDTYKAI